MNTPSTNGANGRGEGGRFAKGNAGGKGNPHARKVALLRAALLASVEPADLKEVGAALLRDAKAGDIAAIRELLDRIFGKPKQEFEVGAAEGEPLYKVFVGLDESRI